MRSGEEAALYSAPESAVVSGNLLFASGIEGTCSAWTLARPGPHSVPISFWPLWPESLEKLRQVSEAMGREGLPVPRA